ncbi:MAG: undecaprenyl-phosphate glucose phosphotransferase [Thermoguttaceae bacterium]
MYRRHGNKLGLVFLAGDLVITTIAWFAAYFARFDLFPASGGVPDFPLILQALPLVLLLAAVAYRLAGLYEIHRLRQMPRELGVVFKASGLLFVLVITTAFYRRDLYESRLALALFFILNALGLTFARRALWRLLRYLRGRGLNHGRAVIVGCGRTGEMVARTIGENNWTGLEAVGFVDQPGRRESKLLPRLGTVDQIAQVVAEHEIDHVFVALPLTRYGELPSVYRALADVLVEVQLVPDLPGFTGMKPRLVEIDGVPFVNLRQNPHRGWPCLAKRGMDLALGSAAILILSPLMLGLALAVKLTSPGPVFYRQRRTGLEGRQFEMLKFRSMRIDAETQTGPVWARREDDRCTPLGRFMRRWSLDELPQFFNVLAGHMSLVGPRPERAVFVEKFRRQIPGYAQRQQVKAGITGWAQVHGWRGNTSLRHRVECDLYYISNWSLWLDLQILLMTLPFGFRHRNAY